MVYSLPQSGYGKIFSKKSYSADVLAVTQFLEGDIVFAHIYRWCDDVARDWKNANV